MKRTIKTLTLTVDEIRQLIESVKSSDDQVQLDAVIEEASRSPQTLDPDKYVQPAARLIAGKFRDKARRLEKQREARKMRRRRKVEPTACDTVKPALKDNVACREPKQLSLALNDHLVRSLAWVYHNRIALTAAIKRINEAICVQDSACRLDDRVMKIMIEIAEQAYDDVLLYQNVDRSSMRPSFVRISCVATPLPSEGRAGVC